MIWRIEFDPMSIAAMRVGLSAASAAAAPPEVKVRTAFPVA
jgi:hypothetical protein